MEISQVLAQLKYSGEAITRLTADVENEAATWKPDSENWSVHEVMYHLAYEEIFDFRFYIGQIFAQHAAADLEKERQTWSNDDPKKEQPLNDLVLLFKKEREKSLAWLNALKEPDWDQEISFSWGSLKAGDFLVSWLAHDLLHLRQLVELRYAFTAQGFPPFSVEYAGKW
jgi:hypothetical protein